MATEPDPVSVARYVKAYVDLLYPDQPDLPDEERVRRLWSERERMQTEMAETLLAGHPLDDAALTERAERSIRDAHLRVALREDGLTNDQIDDLFRQFRAQTT